MVTYMTQIKDPTVVSRIVFERLLLVIVEGRGLGATVDSKYPNRRSRRNPPEALSNGTANVADTPGKLKRYRDLSCVCDNTTRRRQAQGASW